MARKRAGPTQNAKKVNAKAPVAPQSSVGAPFTNGFAQAIGFGGNGSTGFGQGGFPGGGSIQQVEDSTTLFTNLRWYLVSNFRQLLSQLYAEIGLIQTVVNVPVDDGLRGGVMFKSKELDEDQVKQLMLSMDRDDDINTVGWASKWNRLYGGAGILILVDDQDPMLPLDLKAINENTNLEFRAVDMWELFWDKQNTEGYDPEIQAQDFEFYSYYSEKIHKSRVMRMKGITAPSFIRPRLRGWGVSVVETLVRSANQYLKATDLTFEVLDEFKVDYYKIKNLINTLLGPGGTNAVKERVQMANWQKNFQHAVVLDSEDEFDQKQLSFAGLAEVMAGIRMQVASDMRMPITKLFGTSVSSGFQTDQNDMENYNSMVESEVRNKIKYEILRIAEIKCQKMFGFIPDDLEIEFKPLRELGALDQETVKTQKFTRAFQAMQSGLITTLEFRDICNKGNVFDVQLDTTDDGLDLGDPQITQVAGEEQAKDPEKDLDIDDPGANREDTRKVHTTEVLNAKPKFPIRNSAEFDKASYEADGGDDWIDPGRRELFENPGNVDESLWAKAKAASQKAFGKDKWQFVTWWYKKQGGKFK